MIDATNDKEVIDQLEFLKNRLHEDDSIAALNRAINNLKNNQWVDVRDKLPNEDEMHYNGVRDYNDETVRTLSDKVLAIDKDGEIYCGYFMGSCWHHDYNGKGRIKNKYTREGEACWEFGIDSADNMTVISLGTNIEIVAWMDAPQRYIRSDEK